MAEYSQLFFKRSILGASLGPEYNSDYPEAFCIFTEVYTSNISGLFQFN